MHFVLEFSITVLISTALIVFLAELACKYFQCKIICSILCSIVTSLLMLTVIVISFTIGLGSIIITRAFGNSTPILEKTYLIALVILLIISQLKLFFAMGKTESLRKIMINL